MKRIILPILIVLFSFHQSLAVEPTYGDKQIVGDLTVEGAVTADSFESSSADGYHGMTIQNNTTDIGVANSTVTNIANVPSWKDEVGVTQPITLDDTVNTATQTAISGHTDAATAHAATAISHTATGVGGELRDLGSRAEDMVSVLDYIPDGSPCTHAAIKASTCTADLTSYFEAANVASKELFLPSGSYYLADWNVLDDTYVSGTDAKDRTEVTGNVTLVKHTSAVNGVIDVSDTVSSVFEFLAVDGVDDTVAGFYGGTLNFYTRLDHVKVTDCDYAMEGPFKQAQVSFSNFRSSNTALYEFVDSYIVNNNISGNVNQGIRLGTNRSNNYIIGNRIEWVGVGVSMYRCYNNIFSNNIIDRAYNEGLSIVQSESITVSGNQFHRNGKNAAVDADNTHIHIQNSGSIILSGNSTYYNNNDDDLENSTPKFSLYLDGVYGIQDYANYWGGRNNSLGGEDVLVLNRDYDTTVTGGPAADIDIATETITSTNHAFYPGNAVTLSGTLPSPLVAGTVYYIAVLDEFPQRDSFQLGATRADATGETYVPINLTTEGSGSIVITSYDDRSKRSFYDDELLDMSSVSIDKPTEGLILPGHATDCSAATGLRQICYNDTTDKLYIGDGTTANELQAGAPVDATYITQGDETGSLANSQSLGGLTTGLLKNTVTTGVGVLSKAVQGTDFIGIGDNTVGTADLEILGDTIRNNTEGSLLKIDESTGAIGLNMPDPAYQLHLVSENLGIKGVWLDEYSTGGAGQSINLRKARVSLPLPGAVASGDTIGSLLGWGYDGSTHQVRAGIQIKADGTPSAGNVPMTLFFKAGSSAFSTRMQIDSNGDIHAPDSTTPLFKIDGATGAINADQGTYAITGTTDTVSDLDSAGTFISYQNVGAGTIDLPDPSVDTMGKNVCINIYQDMGTADLTITTTGGTASIYIDGSSSTAEIVIQDGNEHDEVCGRVKYGAVSGYIWYFSTVQGTVI